jgi:hypothetical protein
VSRRALTIAISRFTPRLADTDESPIKPWQPLTFVSARGAADVVLEIIVYAVWSLAPADRDDPARLRDQPQALYGGLLGCTRWASRCFWVSLAGRTQPAEPAAADVDLRAPRYPPTTKSIE